MQALANHKNICNDKWLVALVDAMDDVETGRADDICRVYAVPAALMAQLQRRAPARPHFNVAA
jgi:hypothetical protein